MKQEEEEDVDKMMEDNDVDGIPYSDSGDDDDLLAGIDI
jgi:hypothetical protein